MTATTMGYRHGANHQTTRPRSPLPSFPSRPPSRPSRLRGKLTAPNDQRPNMADTQTIKSNLLIVDDEEDHAQVMCEAIWCGGGGGGG